MITELERGSAVTVAIETGRFGPTIAPAGGAPRANRSEMVFTKSVATRLLRCTTRSRCSDGEAGWSIRSIQWTVWSSRSGDLAATMIALSRSMVISSTWLPIGPSVPPSTFSTSSVTAAAEAYFSG